MLEARDQVRAVKTAAATEREWDPSDITVGSVSDLDRGGCAFYRASNEAQLDSQPTHYAVLPDGQVVGSVATDPSALAAVLRACGHDAPAEWWAQVITRFSGEVGGVVVDPETAPSAVRKIREAGAEYAPPTLVTDSGSTTVTFYVMHYEEGTPYRVTAVLSGDGTLRVDRSEPGPDAEHET